MPQISVIIPAYNAERTIIETIQSVQQQTFQDFEIIVINDGSQDKTLELVRSIQDNCTKIFSYENGGLPVARNRGISRATGDYISFIDADDLWTKDKLEKQLLALQQNPEAGVAYSWIVCMVESLDNPDNISFVPGKKATFTGNIYSELLLENFIGNGSNILARREAIESVGEFEPTLKSCEDWDYYLRLAAKWHFILVPEAQILYRKTPGTMTSQASIMEAAGMLVLNRAYQTASINFQQQKNRSLANFYRYCGGLYLNSSSSFKDIAKVRERFWQAIRLYPPILLEKNTQILLIKFLLKQVLPANIIKDLIPLLKRPFLVKDPR
ncbi:glycosyltransferase [Pleurocapsales cyanobacterium LEGE 06147]|nr:glycosyltransferase [Pleurocapsales cyanobacterium LEGE 06147]